MDHIISAAPAAEEQATDGIAIAGAAITIELIELIRKGLDVKALKAFSEESGFGIHELAVYARIPSRTMARRLREGKFPQDESERLVRIMSLFAKTKRLLSSAERAKRWLTTPKISFNGQTPLEFADTDLGAREVEYLLINIEYGSFF